MRAPPPNSWLASLLFLLVTIAVAAMPIEASAADAPGDPAAVAKVTGLNRKALDAYNKRDYEAARGLLKQALQICADAGLAQHPITARTHIHFGVVAIVGFKQRDVGIRQFRKALETQPEIKITKTLSTPALEDAFEEAVAANGAAGAAAGGEEANGGAAEQQADDGENGDGAPKHAKAPPRKKSGDDDDEKEDVGEGSQGRYFVALALGTGFGLASGNAALDPTAHKLSNAGFALAQAGQIAPEVGYFLNPDLLLSVALRLQYVTGVNGKPVTNSGCGADNFCSPGTTAFAAFAKATWLFGTGPLRFTAGGEIGGGTIRHALVFNDSTCKSSASSPTFEKCVDTLNGGPFLVGPTAGLLYRIGSAVDLIFAIDSALGVPNFTFNFDVQAGVGVRL